MPPRTKSLRRRVLLASIVGATAVGRVGHAETVTLTFLNSQPDHTFDAAIAEFQTANPGIVIQPQQVPYAQLNAQIQARLGSKDPSLDVFAVDEPRVPTYAARGYLADLSAYRDATLAAAGPGALRATTWNGKLWTFPLWTTTQFLYYNVELLKKAGLQPPSADPAKRMTWERLLDQARKAQTAGAKWGFAFDQPDRYYEFQPLYESVGAGPGLTGPDMLTPAITSPAWVKVTEWFRDIYASGLAPRGIPYEQMADLFASGQIAYMVGGPWQAAVIVRAHLPFGLAPEPYFANGKPVTPTDSWALGISPYSQHRDAAVKFTSFLTLDAHGSQLAASKVPQIPANLAAAQAYLKVQSASGGEWTAAFADLVTYELAHTAVSRPRSKGYVQFEEIMNKMYSDIRNGAEVAPALKRADAQLRAVFARIE
jgi:multiple sugar transport system substrate-binding protein